MKEMFIVSINLHADSFVIEPQEKTGKLNSISNVHYLGGIQTEVLRYDSDKGIYVDETNTYKYSGNTLSVGESTFALNNLEFNNNGKTYRLTPIMEGDTLSYYVLVKSTLNSPSLFNV